MPCAWVDRGGLGHRTWVHFVEEILPIIHPNFSHTGGILVHDFGNTSRKGVRGFITKDVPNVRTGTDLQHAPALPDLGHNLSLIT